MFNKGYSRTLLRAGCRLKPLKHALHNPPVFPEKGLRDATFLCAKGVPCIRTSDFYCKSDSLSFIGLAAAAVTVSGYLPQGQAAKGGGGFLKNVGRN